MEPIRVLVEEQPFRADKPSVTITVSLSDSVHTLKLLTAKAFGVEVHQVRLFFSSSELENAEATLAALEVCDGSEMIMILRKGFPFELGPFGVVPTTWSANDLVWDKLVPEATRNVFHIPRASFARTASLRAMEDCFTEFPVVGQASPLCPTTLNSQGRYNARIPQNAAHYAWCYPIPKAFHPSDSEMGPNESFLMVGGFAYFDAQLRTIQINSLVPHADDLHFGPAQWWPPSHTKHLGVHRFHEVTITSLREAGARYFMWVRPNEIIPGSSSVICPHGGFVYLFHSKILSGTEEEISMDRIFPVIPSPTTSTANNPATSSSVNLTTSSFTAADMFDECLPPGGLNITREGSELNAESEMLPPKALSPVMGRNRSFEVGTAKISSIRAIPLSELIFHERVGEGEGGEVFRAEWRGTVVAVKKLKKYDKSEVDIQASLPFHNNVIAFHGYASEEPSTLKRKRPAVFIVMPFMINLSVADFLAKNYPAGPETIEALILLTSIAVDASAGLLNLHLENLIHNDIAARNILLSDSLHACVCDFGLSHRLPLGQQQGTVSSPYGCVPWMAPESFKGVYSRQTDVYSFGMFLYEIYTGKVPFFPSDGQSLAGEVVQGRRPVLPPLLPPSLGELLAKCWLHDPSERPSMTSINLQLRAYLQEIKDGSVDAEVYCRSVASNKSGRSSSSSGSNSNSNHSRGSHNGSSGGGGAGGARVEYRWIEHHNFSSAVPPAGLPVPPTSSMRIRPSGRLPPPPPQLSPEPAAPPATSRSSGGRQHAGAGYTSLSSESFAPEASANRSGYSSLSSDNFAPGARSGYSSLASDQFATDDVVRLRGHVPSETDPANPAASGYTQLRSSDITDNNPQSRERRPVQDGATQRLLEGRLTRHKVQPKQGDPRTGQPVGYTSLASTDLIDEDMATAPPLIEDVAAHPSAEELQAQITGLREAMQSLSAQLSLLLSSPLISSSFASLSQQQQQPQPPRDHKTSLTQLFQQLDLENYLPAFLEKECGVLNLPHLSDQELEALIPSKFPRDRLKHYIKEVRLQS